MAYTYLTPYRRGGGSLFDLHKQMNQMFDELLGADGNRKSDDKKGEKGGGGITAWPSLEIDQNDNEITICAELAGMDENDVEISMDDGMLVLTGEKKREKKSDKGYSEFSYGRFERQISVPATVDVDAAEAEFENGLLTIRLPKMEEQASGRKIAIKGGSTRDRNRSEQDLIEQGERKDDGKKAERKDQKDKEKA
jgi:HSP20 family protein